jgi:hypothetical protein
MHNVPLSTMSHTTSSLAIPSTPSGLTPNTRSEAEAALTHNVLTQTESAAPTTPLPPRQNPLEDIDLGTIDEAKRVYRSPQGPIRTSSSNYTAALAAAHAETSASSELSTDTTDDKSPVQAASGITDGARTASPMSSTIPFPPPGQGVIPLRTGIGSGQAEVVKKARPHGLSLGDLGRRQSWNQQDMKHVASAGLLRKVDGDAGYASGQEEQE